MEAVWGLKYSPMKIRKNLWSNTFSNFDIAFEKLPKPNRKVIFQPAFFRESSQSPWIQVRDLQRIAQIYRDLFFSDSLTCHIWSVEPIEPCFDSFLWNFPLDLLSRIQWKQGSHSTILFLFLLSNGAKKHRFSKMDLLLWCFYWPSFARENMIKISA